MQRLAWWCSTRRPRPPWRRSASASTPTSPRPSRLSWRKSRPRELALREDTLVLSEQTVKRIEKQSIKTATGIEVKIPSPLARQPDAVRFITNPDGTPLPAGQGLFSTQNSVRTCGRCFVYKNFSCAYRRTCSTICLMLLLPSVARDSMSKKSCPRSGPVKRVLRRPQVRVDQLVDIDLT